MKVSKTVQHWSKMYHSSQLGHHHRARDDKLASHCVALVLHVKLVEIAKYLLTLVIIDVVVVVVAVVDFYNDIGRRRHFLLSPWGFLFVVPLEMVDFHFKHTIVGPGNAHLNFEGGSISTVDLLVLTG